MDSKARFGLDYIWLRLLLTIGSLLGLLLLVQSVATYYQLTRSLITAQLRKEAQQHVNWARCSKKSGGTRRIRSLGSM